MTVSSFIAIGGASAWVEREGYDVQTVALSVSSGKHLGDALHDTRRITLVAVVRIATYIREVFRPVCRGEHRQIIYLHIV